MIVDNIFAEGSIRYKEQDGETADIRSRMPEILDLDKMVNYCRDIGEPIRKTDKIYYEEICEGVPLYEFIYQPASVNGVTEDVVRMLQEIIDKGMIQRESRVVGEKAGAEIWISLGVYPECAGNLGEYLSFRRRILTRLTDPYEFGIFMTSCFPNSIFADDIAEPMRDIEEFKKHENEIIDNLIVLDEQAVKLYKEYNDNLDEAMRQLTAQLLECSYENRKHSKAVTFKFSYEETVNGSKVARVKDIECSPHLKLIQKNSNLRIYFYWKDKDVGEGEKVLIGRIGGHPYPDPKKN